MAKTLRDKYNGKPYAKYNEWNGKGPHKNGNYEKSDDFAYGGELSDCSHFVHDILLNAKVDVPYVSTATIKNHKNYMKVPSGEQRRGDIIVQGGHMGIFARLNKWEDDEKAPWAFQLGTTYSSTSKGHVTEAPFGIKGFFSPKKPVEYYRPITKN